MLSVWESRTYPLQLPLRKEREYPRKPRIGKQTRPGNRGSPGQGRLITLPAIWKDPWGRRAVEETLIDTGAKTTFINETWAQQNSLHVTTMDKNIPITLGDETCSPEATRQARGTITIKGHNTQICAMVIKLGWDIIIGQDWQQKNKPMIDWERNTIRLHSMETAKLPAWLEDIKKVFEDSPEGELPKRKGEFNHEINLTVDSLPMTPIIPLRPDNQAFVKDYLDTMLRKEYIRISKSSKGASLFLVPKKDGKQPVVNYRKLNDVTEKDFTPLPRIDDMLDQLIESQLFTKIDLKDAFNQLRIKEGDEWKTAFKTRYETFKYLVMPFGLTNAPATFQKYVNWVLKEKLDQEGVAYVDNILVTGHNQVTHREKVQNILMKIYRAGLRAKLAKCQFEVPRVEFLGYVVGKEGVSIDPKKTQAVKDWNPPKTVKQLQAFLGFINFYRKFIQGAAEKSFLLTELTKKDQKWKWKDKHQQAFDKLKKELLRAPLLGYFDPTKRLIIETGASDHTTAAVISQEIERGLQPLEFMSKKMTSAEQNYTITEKEMLAIIQAVKE